MTKGIDRFKHFLKFVWQDGDVHKGGKEEPKVDAKRARRFTWHDEDLEHHDDHIKEVLTEKFQLKPEHPGNFEAPHQIEQEYDHSEHPFNKVNFHEYTNANGAKRSYIGPTQRGLLHYAERHHNLSQEEHHASDWYKGSGAYDVNSHLRKQGKLFKDQKKAYLKSQYGSKPKFVGDKFNHPDNKYGAQSHGSDKGYFNPYKEKAKAPRPDAHDHGDLEDQIAHLDSVTNHPTPEHHTVFRGGHPGDYDKFPVGHEFTDHGYTSTSFKHGVAQSFADSSAKKKHAKRDWTSKKIVHVIHVPKGSKGHYFDTGSTHAYEHYKDEDYDGTSGHEYSNSHEKEFVLHRGTRFKVTHHSESPDTHYIHSRVVSQGQYPRMNMKVMQGKGHKKDQGTFPFMKQNNTK